MAVISLALSRSQYHCGRRVHWIAKIYNRVRGFRGCWSTRRELPWPRDNRFVSSATGRFSSARSRNFPRELWIMKILRQGAFRLIFFSEEEHFTNTVEFFRVVVQRRVGQNGRAKKSFKMFRFAPLPGQHAIRSRVRVTKTMGTV